jgi:hypothetical protein
VDVKRTFRHRSLAGLSLAAALVALLLLPAHALGVTVRAPAQVFKTADIAAVLSSDEATGMAMLFVDNSFVSSALIETSTPTTFTAIPLAAGSHSVAVVVRGRDGVSAPAATAVRAWSVPVVPAFPAGLCPAFASKVTTFPLTADSSTKTLSVTINGKRVWSRDCTKPGAVAPTITLAAGVNTVVLKAENPFVSSAATMTLTRPTWPLPGNTRLTSYFGWRLHPILNEMRFHAGLDIAGPYGTPIVAAGAGTVVFAGWNGGYGNFIMVDHGHGVVSCYGHQSKFAVVKGQKVSRGQRIGYVGTTGLSTGPHLHFEVRVNGVPTDPLAFL